MYSLIKKSILTFLLLNPFIVQSAMADMLFYYNAAILPSIISSTGGGGSDGSNVNTTFKGSLAVEGSDSYSFTAKSTGDVWFGWNDDNTNLSVYLYEGTNPDTYIYVSDDYDGSFSAYIEEGSTYTVAIVNKSDYSIDAYNVNIVTTNDDRGEAVALVPNKSYTDTLNDQDDSLRVYNFVANSTGEAKVKVNWYGDTQYAYTYVYENGVYKDYWFGSDGVTVNFSTVKGRTYSIIQKFTDTDYFNLEYNIEVVTTNDTRGDAVSVVPNTPYIKTLNQDKDSLDIYNFTASSNGTAHARASWRGDANYAYVYVYQDGVYLDYWFGSDGVTVAFDVREGRNYTVLVNFTDTDHVDIDYGFEVATTNDSRGNAVTLSPNSHYNATMHEAEDFLDVYNFTATSTGSARAMASWRGDTNYAYMYLYENGVYKDYWFGSDSVGLSFETVKDRTYSLIFRATDTDGLDDSYSFNFATTDQANATVVTLAEEYNSIVNEDTNTYATYSFTPTAYVSATASAIFNDSYTPYGYIYLYENGVYKDYWFGSSNASITYNFVAGRTYTMIVKMTDTDHADMDITFSIKE